MSVRPLVSARLSSEHKLAEGSVAEGGSVGTGGEVPNLPCVFSDNNNRYWKIPKIDLPKGAIPHIQTV